MLIGTLDLRLVLGVTGLCTALYKLLCCLFPQRSCEWHCRSVTMLHAVTVTLMGLWCTFIQGPWPCTDAGGPNTPTQVLTMSICLGYFLFDFGWCIAFQTEGPTMMIHHAVSIAWLLTTLTAGKYGTETVVTISEAEISNPLLQLRWYLRETNRYNTLAGDLVDFLFVVTFTVMRIVYASYLLYCYYQQPTDFLGRLGGTSMYVIGWVFWIQVVKFAIRKCSKKLRLQRERSRNSATHPASNSSHLPPGSAKPPGSVGADASEKTLQAGPELRSRSPPESSLLSQGEPSPGSVLTNRRGSAIASSSVVHRKL